MENNFSTPEHLGGHGNKTWIDQGSLKYMVDSFGVKSMLDIGCGPGGMREVCNSLGVKWFGIDGDPAIKIDDENYINWDLCDGIPLMLADVAIDLAWSVEFLEHVEEEYQHNYMRLFQKCRWAIVTAAPPGWDGHHHVNCKPKEYWINVFKDYGFRHRNDVLRKVKRSSTMDKKRSFSWIDRTGMCFERVY